MFKTNKTQICSAHFLLMEGYFIFHLVCYEAFFPLKREKGNLKSFPVLLFNDTD